MDTHKDASLVLRQKSIANARSVMEGGWSKAASARAFHTTPKAVAQWVARFRAEGLAGLQDHSATLSAKPSCAGPMRQGRSFPSAAPRRRADRRGNQRLCGHGHPYPQTAEAQSAFGS